MKQKFDTRTIVITGLLLALEVIFQTLGNHIQFPLLPANINLTLVTVVLAAVWCGPISAMILGFFNGIMALFSPSTLAIFMPISPVGTVVVCLLKCTIAGLVASLIYRGFNKINRIVGMTAGVILASATVPIVNTGLFSVGSLIFFRPFLESGVNETFPNIGAFLVFGVIGLNFIVEIVTTVLIAPPSAAIVLGRRVKNPEA
ncbi:MAG: ECF transporter S component [Bacilli bacterium]|nr:ECF transporter S component [Bacilli bacterium]